MKKRQWINNNGRLVTNHKGVPYANQSGHFRIINYETGVRVLSLSNKDVKYKSPQISI